MTEIHLTARDGVEGLELVSRSSVDVVVTSPPYNLGVQYRKYKDTLEFNLYVSWTRDWLSAVDWVLKPNGSLFLNLGSCPSKPMLPFRIVCVAAEIFKLQNTFHWIKAISVERKEQPVLSVGHFKPINSKRFVNDCHEFVFHLTKTGKVPVDRLALGVPYADESNVKRWTHSKGVNKRCRGNVWYLPYETIVNRNKQRPHPATFPPKLAENAIRVHGGNLSELTVVDPFVGIGSAAIGAIQAGAGKFFGFDIDSSYIEEANRRVATRQP